MVCTGKAAMCWCYSKACVKCRGRLFCRAHKSSAFSLVEILVVIALMAVLIALSLPGVRSTRDKSLGIKCLANERGVVQLLAVGSGSHRDEWANAQTPGMGVFDYEPEAGVTTRLASVRAQLRLWNGALFSQGLFSKSSDHRSMSCPVGWARNVVEFGEREHRGPETSFFYSLAVVTGANYWTPDNVQEAADRYRGIVHVSDVVFPSNKVLMSEQRTFHDGSIMLDGTVDIPKRRLNMVFCDGHGAMLNAAAAKPALSIIWNEEPNKDTPRAVLFSSSVSGFRGLDY